MNKILKGLWISRVGVVSSKLCGRGLSHVKIPYDGSNAGEQTQFVKPWAKDLSRIQW